MKKIPILKIITILCFGLIPYKHGHLVFCMMIYSFSYQSENGEVFIIKSKIINNHGYMFNEIKKYWLVKEMKDEKDFIGKIVYSFDDGELITEYTEITVW